MTKVSLLADVDAINSSLSSARMSTYTHAVVAFGRVAEPEFPIKLYEWNAAISSAFLTPLQVCEVVVRNGISSAIEQRYGPTWPWIEAFEKSLPQGSRGFSARAELTNVRAKFPIG